MTFFPNRRYDLLLPDDPNFEQFSKYGTLVDVDDNETPIDIYSGADISPPDLREYQFSTVAGSWSISSTNAGDTQTVRILRLIDDFEIDVINVELNGQTPVALSGDTIRVLKINNAGSSDFAGDIYLYETTTTTGGVPDTITNTRAYIPAGPANSWSSAVLTVPNDFTCFITNVVRSMNKDSGGGSDREANFDLRFRPQGGVFFESVPFSMNSKSGASLVFDPAIQVGAKFDVLATAIFVLNNGTSITVGLQTVMQSDDVDKMAILKGF